MFFQYDELNGRLLWNENTKKCWNVNVTEVDARHWLRRVHFDKESYACDTSGTAWKCLNNNVEYFGCWYEMISGLTIFSHRDWLVHQGVLVAIILNMQDPILKTKWFSSRSEETLLILYLLAVGYDIHGIDDASEGSAPRAFSLYKLIAWFKLKVKIKTERKILTFRFRMPLENCWFDKNLVHWKIVNQAKIW